MQLNYTVYNSTLVIAQYMPTVVGPIFKIISFAIGLSIQLATKHRHAHFSLHLVAALSTLLVTHYTLRNLGVKIMCLLSLMKWACPSCMLMGTG